MDNGPPSEAAQTQDNLVPIQVSLPAIAADAKRGRATVAAIAREENQLLTEF